MTSESAPMASSKSTAAPSAARAWLLATRPKTLTAAWAPVLVGSALAIAHGGFAWLPALAALLGASLIQIGTNLANDYYDFKKGADTEARLGPARATQQGWISPESVLRGMWISFALAVVVGAYLVWIGGWPIVAIGAASIVSGIAYTGGPYPLGYNGLGDIFVMVFFGFVAVGGTFFVQAGVPTADVWIAAVPMGALATAILAVNNLRDADTDVAAGKRTVAVRFGKPFARIEYVALIVASYAALGGLMRLGYEAWVLLPFLSLPLALRGVRSVYRDVGTTLNGTLALTAALVAAFGALLATGLVLGAP